MQSWSPCCYRKLGPRLRFTTPSSCFGATGGWQHAQSTPGWLQRRRGATKRQGNDAADTFLGDGASLTGSGNSGSARGARGVLSVLGVSASRSSSSSSGGSCALLASGIHMHGPDTSTATDDDAFMDGASRGFIILRNSAV
mmetsp:Transcript_122183/g.304987  ORF Transcript_122183/g.304987 Transcript_122183/m.304987 type:complete len:141 (+) Transcript_122183:497-919(+)